MQKQAYKLGQYQALKQLNLIKIGATPQQLELPFTQRNALKMWVKKNPILATGAAIGLGYGAHGLLRGRDASPEAPATLTPQNPLLQGSVY